MLAFPGVPAAALQEVVDAFLARERVEVTRTFKTGPRTFDVREAVVSLSVAGEPELGHLRDTVPDAIPALGPDCAILRLVVRHTTPAVRPDDILTALRAVATLEPPRPPLVTRLAQGPLDATARVTDPLAADERVGDS